MNYNTISKAYAKSLYQLGREQSVAITKELTTLNEAINANSHLENVLFMDVFTIDEKIGVVEAIVQRLKLHQLTKAVLTFLIKEKRIHLFPLVLRDIVGMDYYEKGILPGTLEGADDEMEPMLLEKIKVYLEKTLNKKIYLDYKIKPELLAGCRVTVEDFQIDASLDKQFDRLKQDNVLNK